MYSKQPCEDKHWKSLRINMKQQIFSKILKCALVPILSVVVYFIICYYGRDNDVRVEGHFHRKCRKVAELFREQLTSGSTRGATFAVYYKGRQVINLWGGYADYSFKIPWREDSLVAVASVTKGVAAVVVALLVQRGKLNYSEPVYKYWPEFTSHGKEKITIEMLLSHQSGLIRMDPRIPVAVVKDWVNRVRDIDTYLIQQKPTWEPGKGIGYQAASHGFYLDALVRYVDDKHRTISKFFNDEIALPYGIDFYIGLPKHLFYRKVRDDFDDVKLGWYLDALKSKRSFDLALNTFINPNFISALDVLENGEAMRSNNDHTYASIPSVSGNGFGTADSVAKLFSLISNPAAGQTLLNKDIISLLQEPIASGDDLVCGIKATYTRGLFLMKNAMGEEVIGHTGFGGQLAFADIRRELSMSYITNDYTIYALGGDPRVKHLEKLAYECIKNV